MSKGCTITSETQGTEVIITIVRRWARIPREVWFIIFTLYTYIWVDVCGQWIGENWPYVECLGLWGLVNYVWVSGGFQYPSSLVFHTLWGSLFASTEVRLLGRLKLTPPHYFTKHFRHLKWRVSWTLWGYFGGYVFPYISLTCSLYRWVPPF